MNNREKFKKVKTIKTTVKCPDCQGWINPPWKRGDGAYRHCDCKNKE